MAETVGNPQHVALIGAGPVGTALAAALELNQVPCTWVVRNPARRATLEPFILRHGLNEVELSLEQFHILAATTSLDPAQFGWAVLAVKAQHVSPLAASLSAMGFQRILAVANGLHTDAIHLGLLHGGVQLEGSKLLLHSPSLLLRIGPLAGAPPGLPYPPLATPWMQLELLTDARLAMYDKLILNCVINPLTALLDCENGALKPFLGSPLVQGIVSEGCRVAQSVLGWHEVIEPPAVNRELERLVQATATNSSSMREDLLHGRETEIAYINQALAANGEELGIPCPFNAAVARVVSLGANRGTR